MKRVLLYVALASSLLSLKGPHDGHWVEIWNYRLLDVHQRVIIDSQLHDMVTGFIDGKKCEIVIPDHYYQKIKTAITDLQKQLGEKYVAGVAIPAEFVTSTTNPSVVNAKTNHILDSTAKADPNNEPDFKLLVGKWNGGNPIATQEITNSKDLLTTKKD